MVLKKYRVLLCAIAGSMAIGMWSAYAEDVKQTEGKQGTVKTIGSGNNIQITDEDVGLWRKYLVPSNVTPTNKALYNRILETFLFAKEAENKGLESKEIELRTQVYKNSLLAKEYEQACIANNLHFTESEIESFYLSHLEEAMRSSVYELYRIVVQDEATAQRVFDEASSPGIDFTVLVQNYSCDPGTKARQGNVGKVEEKNLPPLIANTVKVMQSPGVIKPVSENGFYYIYWVKNIEPAYAIPLEKARDEIIKKAEAIKKHELISKCREELVAKYGFKWTDEVATMLENEPSPVAGGLH